MRRAQADKSGNNVYPAGGGNRGRDRFGFGRGRDQAQLIAQPLHRGAGDEDAALDGELAPALCEAARVDSRRLRETAGGRRCASARSSRAVRVLGKTARKTACPARAAC